MSGRNRLRFLQGDLASDAQREPRSRSGVRDNEIVPLDLPVDLLRQVVLHADLLDEVKLRVEPIDVFFFRGENRF